jgi:hypothetical protein
VIERGRQVLIKAYGEQQLQRIVWADVGKGLLLTTEREYNRAIKENTEPISVGFPKDDLIRVLDDDECMN